MMQVRLLSVVSVLQIMEGILALLVKILRNVQMEKSS